MRHAVVGLMTVVAGCVMDAGPWLRVADAAEPRRTALVVRTYTERAAAADMETARRTAGAILGRAGIEVTWLECGLPADVVPAAPDTCDQPRRENELLVRIVPAGAADARNGGSTLGFAFVDLGAGGGSLATVYTDRVRAMAEQAGTDPAELLGRAIAHEVGHLLLGTNRHAPHGLMRASWTAADLRGNRATQWLFDGRESEAMRRGIAGRLHQTGLLASIADARDQQLDVPLR
jgi:hypothetical protein